MKNDELLMDDAEFEELLTKALYRAAELDAEETPSDTELEELVKPSKKFQRKMRTLLRNPNKYAHNARRPTHVKIMRIAATFLITLTVLFTTIMAASPTVRAAVVNFVRTWFEDRTEYHVPHRDLHQDWTIGYIPEGFELVEEHYHVLQNIFIFENNDSVEIKIIISTGNQQVNNEHSEFYNTLINGNITDIYLSNDIEHPNIIVIHYIQEGVVITLISEIDVSELIKIAENIY